MAESSPSLDRYEAADKQVWDDFVSRSKNGTFLFHRGYMDYHSDRFEDHSLIVRDSRGKVLALLPANRSGSELISHEGLTYGGFVTDERMKTPVMLDMFDRLLEYLKASGMTRLLYKCVPHTYHRLPAEEDLYALFRVGAALCRRDVSVSIDLSRRLEFQERRSRGVAKAERSGIRVAASEDFDEFWKILEENLGDAHDAKPVHTVADMRLLHDRFPENIRLFEARKDDSLVGGVLVYATREVAHAQYIAASRKGKDLHALDALFSHLVLHEPWTQTYFDFGISTERGGSHLNDGLIDFKEGFGGRAIVHDFYRIDLK